MSSFDHKDSKTDAESTDLTVSAVDTDGAAQDEEEKEVSKPLKRTGGYFQKLRSSFKKPESEVDVLTRLEDNAEAGTIESKRQGSYFDKTRKSKPKPEPERLLSFPPVLEFTRGSKEYDINKLADPENDYGVNLSENYNSQEVVKQHNEVQVSDTIDPPKTVPMYIADGWKDSSDDPAHIKIIENQLNNANGNKEGKDVIFMEGSLGLKLKNDEFVDEFKDQWKKELFWVSLALLVVAAVFIPIMLNFSPFIASLSSSSNFTGSPTISPSEDYYNPEFTGTPTLFPTPPIVTDAPTKLGTSSPTKRPTKSPTKKPTLSPTLAPSVATTPHPTTVSPTPFPTTVAPTLFPTTSSPTNFPTSD